jgi:hypothetical protein
MNQNDHNRRIAESLAALDDDIAAMNDAIAEARTHHAAMSQHNTNARDALAEARAIADRLAEQLADEEG